MSDSLWLHGQSHTRPPCPSPASRAYSNSCPSIESVIPSNHLIVCPPLLLLPSIFPSIMVFSNESILHIRWPKYWSFSFSISPSNECVLTFFPTSSKLLMYLFVHGFTYNPFNFCKVGSNVPLFICVFFSSYSASLVSTLLVSQKMNFWFLWFSVLFFTLFHLSLLESFLFPFFYWL